MARMREEWYHCHPALLVLTAPSMALAGMAAWPAALQWIASAMNSTAGLDESCVAAAAKAGKGPGEACTLPEDVAPYIQVPLFVMVRL